MHMELAADDSVNDVIQGINNQNIYTDEPASPVVNRQGNVTKHQDGTYSVKNTAGNVVRGLDELTAKTYAIRDAQENQAIEDFAPIGNAGNRVHGIASTAVDLGVQGASAFTGNTTLNNEVDLHNQRAKRFNRLDEVVTPQELETYRTLGQDVERTESDDTFRATSKHKRIAELDKQATTNKAQFDAIEAFGKGVKKHVPVNRADQLTAQKAFEVIAKNDGNWAAAWNAVTNDLGTFLESGIDSVPYMIAFTVGGPIAQSAILTSLAVGKGNQAIEEFRTTNNREPSAKELGRIKAWSAVATVAEKFGDMAALKAIPIARLNWVQKTVRAVNKSLPASIANLTIVRPTLALVGEGVSGGITATAEQLAQAGKITDTGAIAHDALAEALGTPGGVSAMVAARATIGVTKAAVVTPIKAATAKSRAAGLREQLAQSETVQGTPAGDAINERVDVIEQILKDTPNHPNKEVILAERADLLEQLTAENPEFTAEDRAAVQAEYDALPERVRPEVAETKAAEAAKTAAEEALAVSEITDTELDAALDTITDNPETLKESLATLQRVGKRALTEAQIARKEAKKTEFLATLAVATKEAEEQEAAAAEKEDGTFRNVISGEDVAPAVIEKADKEAKTKADKAQVENLKITQKLGKELTEIEKAVLTKAGKSSEDVHQESIDGTSTRWKGFNTYFDEINTAAKTLLADPGNAPAVLAMKTSLQRMSVHSGNIRRKHNAFVAAAKKEAKTGKPVYVRGNVAAGGNRVMEYTQDTEMTAESFKIARDNKEYVYEIHQNSGEFIGTVSKEADYGEAMFKLAMGHKDTTFAQTAAAATREAVALAAAVEELNAQEENRTAEDITEEDVDAINDLEGTETVSAEAAPDTASSTAGDTSSEQEGVSEQNPPPPDAPPANIDAGDDAADQDGTPDNTEESPDVEAAETEDVPAGEVSETEEDTVAEDDTVIKEPKYEVVPGGYANAEQRVAIDKIGDWLKDTGSAIREFVLEGRGGTGKTTVVSKIIENSGLTKKQILYTATTNKAKAILAKATGEEASTIWTALGLIPTDEKQRKEGLEDIEDLDGDKLEGIKLLVVDEASMLGENMTQLIKEKAAERGIKVLFLGDSAQLAPIRSAKEALKVAASALFGRNSNSPVFDEAEYPNRVKLLKPQRQIGKSPILGLTGLFTAVLDDVKTLQEKIKEKAVLITKGDRKTNFSESTNSGVIFTGDAEFVATSFVKDYLLNPLSTRIVTAFNENNRNQGASVFNLNRDIFERLFGDTRVYGIHAVGDVLMSYSTVKLQPKDEGDAAIWNSSEYEILEVGEVEHLEFEGVSIPYQEVLMRDLINGEEIKTRIPAVTDTDTFPDGKTLQEAISAEYAKAKKRLNAEQYTKFKEQNVAVSRIANIEMHPAYAITAWKAQGSTYRNVYVMEDGLNSIGGWTNGSPKNSYQALYVATSRPTDKLVMHSANRNAGSTEVSADSINFSSQNTNVGADTTEKVESAPEGTVTAASTTELTQRQKDYDSASLTDKVIALIKKGTTANVLLQQLIDTATNPAYVELAKALVGKVGAVKVQYTGVRVQREDEEFDGYVDYDLIEGTGEVVAKLVTLSPGALNEELTLHELLHVAAVSAFKSPNSQTQRDAVAQLEAIAAHIKEYVADPANNVSDYDKSMLNRLTTIKHADELMTYGLTNKHLQRLLMDMKAIDLPNAAKPKGSIWSQLVASVSKLLGLAKTDNTLLGQVFEASGMLLVETGQANETFSTPIKKAGTKVGKKAGEFKKLILTETLPVLDATVSFVSEFVNQQIMGSTKSGITLKNKTFAELVKITKKRVGLFNIPSEAFNSPQTLMDALRAIGLSDEGAELYANRYTAYAAAYANLVTSDDYIAGNGFAPALKTPLRLLEQFSTKVEDGKTVLTGEAVLPPQVVFALMMGAQNWIAQNTNDNPLSSDQEKGEFLYGDRRRALSATDYNALEGVGLDHKQAVQSVANVILASLGISASSKYTAAYVDSLGTALGSMAFEIINNEAQVPGSTVAFINVNVGKWDFGYTPQQAKEVAESEEGDGRNFTHGQQYKHITHAVEQGSVEELEKSTELNNAAISVLTDGAENDSNSAPLQAPAKFTASSIRRSFGDVPKKMREVLEKLQNVVWGETSTLPLIAAMSEDFRGTVELLMGVVPVDEKTDTKAYVTSANASNGSKTDALDSVLKFSTAGKLKNFFFKYALQSQHRIMQVGLGVNPQNSHFTRWAVAPQGTTTFTKENLHLFQFAAMYALGYKVDKRVPVNIVSTFNEYMEDADIQEAIALLRAADSNMSKVDMEKFNAVVLKLYTKENSPYSGADISLLGGLHALSIYAPYHAAWKAHMTAMDKHAVAVETAKATGEAIPVAPEAPKMNFESDIPAEIDGVANGFAINIFQFPTFNDRETLEKHLNQTAVYIGKTPEETTHLEGGIHALNKDRDDGDKIPVDTYMDLGALIQHYSGMDVALTYHEEEKGKDQDWLDKLSETYVARSQALAYLFPDLADQDARDLAKYPFVMSQYGAGNPAVATGVAKTIISHLYQEIGVLRRLYIADKVEGAKQIEEFERQLDVLGMGNNVGNKIKNNMHKGHEFNEEIFQNVIKQIIEPRLARGLDALLGDTKDYRMAVVQAGEIMHAVFMAHFIAARDKKLADEKRSSLTESETVALVQDGLKKWLPQYKGPLSDAGVDSFIDMSKRVSDKSDSNAHTVSVRVQDHVDGGTRDVTATARQQTFSAPGVSALIRGIINTDAALLALSLDKVPHLLPLYDAAFGRPELLAEFAEIYNAEFKRLGLSPDVNLSLIMKDQMEKVLIATEQLDADNGTALMTEVENWIRDTAHVNRFLEGTDKKDVAELRQVVISHANEATQKKDELREIESTEGLEPSQMYIPNMSETNPEAGKSMDSAVAEIQAAGTAHKMAMFLIHPAVARLADSVRNYITGMFRNNSPHEVANILAQYTAETARDFVNIALADSINNPYIGGMTETLKEMFPTEDRINVREIIISLLTGDTTNNTTILEGYRAKVGAAYDGNIAKMEAELRKYEVTVDLGETQATIDADIKAVVEAYNSLGNQEKSDEKTVFSKDITKASVTALLSRFKNISRHYYGTQQEMDSHSATLQRIIDTMGRGLDSIGAVRMTVEQINGVTQGAYDSVNKRMTVSLSRQLPGNRNEYSPQEVYAHELLHAMTVQAIRDNPLIGDQIREVRKQTKKLVDKQGGFKAFLSHIPGTATPSEIKLAKDQYNYVFGPDAAHLPEEFLAYATTNPAMIRITQSFTTVLPDRGTTLAGRFVHLIDLIVDSFTRVIFRKNKENAHEESLAILVSLIDIQTRHDSQASKLETKTRDLVRGSDKMIREFISAAVHKAIKASPNNALGKVSRSAAAIGVAALGEGAARDAMVTAGYSQITGLTKALADEVGKGALTLKLIKRLLFAKVNINKLFQQVERDSVRTMNAAWKSVNSEEISKQAREAITRVVLKTDLQSLLADDVGMTPQQIVKLIGNPALIKQEIKKLAKASNLKSTSMAFKYTMELGYFLATKKRKRPQGHFNVSTIAATYLTGDALNANTIRRMDAIATLSALLSQKSEDNAVVKDMMARELEADPDTNAFEFMLNRHRAFVAMSLDNLFDGNGIQTQKGFTVDRIDDLTDMITGVDTPEERKAMARKGYPHVYKMGNIPGVPQAHNVMYVSRSMPENRHVSGILSTTGLHHSGTLLSDILAKNEKFQKADKTPDISAIRAHIAKIHKRESNLEKMGIEDEEQRLSPIRDGKNNIVDYRVIMNADSVEAIFQPDMEFQNVFAHMRSSYINKKNTIDADKATIDVLGEEWVKVYPGNEKMFVDILDPKSKYHEQYRKLPREVREYMHKFSLDGKFMVRENIVYKTFGYSALNPANLEFLQNESLGWMKTFIRRGYAGIREVMSFGMERVVMATLMVVINNFVSNLLALTIRGISPAYTAKKMREGYQAYIRYEADTEKQRDLHQKLQVASVLEKPKVQSEYDAVTAEVNNNPIHLLSAFGLNSLVVEDVNTSSSKGYLNRMNSVMQQDKVTQYTDKIPSQLTSIAKNIVLHRDSEVYRTHKKIVQITDFLGRYVMISHAVDVKGQSFEDALHDAIDQFVLFDENMHPILEVLNSMGFSPFLTYKLRNIRSVRNMLQRSPTGIGVAAGMQYGLDVETLANASGPLTGNLMPTLLGQGDLLDSASTIAGPSNVEDVWDWFTKTF